jgi:Protein of unknown function (DUF3551)
MRNVFIALATSAVVFTAGMQAAAAKDYPYCIQGEDYAGAGDCSFSTNAQCLATASGRLAYCAANRSYTESAQPIDRSHMRHRSN